jgi:hypothetical protein
MKMAFFIKGAGGVSHEQLLDHWLSRHAPGVREHMLADHYSVTDFRQRSGTPFDGLAQLWYSDEATGPAMFANQPEVVANDGFVALTGDFVRLDSTEHVIVDGERPEGALKMVYPVSFKDGVDHDEAKSYWLEVHAPLVGNSLEVTEGAHRYVVTHQIDSSRGRYAGFAEFWYDDKEALVEHGRILQGDDFADYAVTHAPLMGTEHVIIP